MPDEIDHPAHYTSLPGGIECIDVVQHMNFCRGAAIKYVWRAGEKGDAVTDLRKAIKMLEFEIARLEDERDEQERQCVSIEALAKAREEASLLADRVDSGWDVEAVERAKAAFGTAPEDSYTRVIGELRAEARGDYKFGTDASRALDFAFNRRAG
jgi:hypothetical protein